MYLYILFFFNVHYRIINSANRKDAKGEVTKKNINISYYINEKKNILSRRGFSIQTPSNLAIYTT